MRRVVVLGRGGSGKSTLSRRLGIVTGLPVVELDTLFWNESLSPLPKEVWSERQSDVACQDTWIMDGDLGPYDVLAPRLARADAELEILSSASDVDRFLARFGDDR